MLKRFAKSQLQLMKYALLIGSIGGIFSFIGPLHSPLYNTSIGVAMGILFLGRKLIKVMTNLWVDNNKMCGR